MVCGLYVVMVGQPEPNDSSTQFTTVPALLNITEVEEVNRARELPSAAGADLVVAHHHRVLGVRDAGGGIDLPHLALLGARSGGQVVLHVRDDVVAGDRGRLERRLRCTAEPPWW